MVEVAEDFLNNAITAHDVEQRIKLIDSGGKAVESKLTLKFLVLRALTEGNLLKGTMQPREMSDMEFQLEMRKLEIHERER